MNLHKKYTVKPYFFLVIDTFLVSDNPSLSERLCRNNIKTSNENRW